MHFSLSLSLPSNFFRTPQRSTVFSSFISTQAVQSMGSQRVRHDWATSLSLFTYMRWRRKGQPTPVFLPGESQGWGSRVGHDWSDLAAAAARTFCFYPPKGFYVYWWQFPSSQTEKTSINKIKVLDVLCLLNISEHLEFGAAYLKETRHLVGPRSMTQCPSDYSHRTGFSSLPAYEGIPQLSALSGPI